MQRVLMNLMQNAVIHGRTGLRVRTYMAGAFLEVAIQDSGPGVAADLLPQLKQPFQRGPSRDDDSARGGTGLGLAIADRIAREHGGRLELESVPGHGMTATVLVPVASQTVAQKPTPPY
jgi:two-component system osmolarity sensor histidine kinase EnvZ